MENKDLTLFPKLSGKYYQAALLLSLSFAVWWIVLNDKPIMDVEVGMRASEVLDIMGEPKTDILVFELPGHSQKKWLYGDHIEIDFNNDTVALVLRDSTERAEQYAKYQKVVDGWEKDENKKEE